MVGTVEIGRTIGRMVGYPVIHVCLCSYAGASRVCQWAGGVWCADEARRNAVPEASGRRVGKEQ